jgi:hypothetical protein
MEQLRLAGDRRFFEYTARLDSGEDVAELQEALAERDRLKAELLDQKKRTEDWMSHAKGLRQEYDRLLAQPIGD